ncbi:GTPase Era [Schleiferiaceae bacterium]|jgi:GTP-binding protein Era|nr:GTPase Era [Schleiferiaceae bacterium]MDA8565084.1 GTPase Era [Schleiferiaceae bacterium]MDA8642372.1 GTPase Era [Schleiferiaceae bacterium]MDA8661368.1 GTPase Era [Schleiferiaceae bacterium]MDA8764988.1 GTPase Era [Schleiferiaceae bacterium]
MEHKSGFVNIIGNPNVGKSTLMNAMVGERLSIITPKAQTTRHRIFGILNEPEYQIVFSDTPGVIQPAYKMQEHMMKFVSDAFEDADVFLYLVEPGDRALKDEGFFQKLATTTVPVLLIVNKIDTTTQEALEEEVGYWQTSLPNAEIIPISALEGANTDYLLSRLKELVPVSPPYFDKDALTDKTERFFVSEIIREQILLNYKKEIPYSVEVDVEEFKEEEDIIRMRCIIYVARDSQKGILIGHKGSRLKAVGIGARKQLEAFFAKKVHVETFVKVKKNWRDNDLQLKRFGYRN